MYKAILFDMDGLMIDTECLYMEYFSAQLVPFACHLTKDIFKGQMGLGIIDEAQYLLKTFQLDVSLEEMVQLLDTRKLHDNIAQDQFDIVTMPGLQDILEIFSSKMRLAIGTGSPKRVMDYVVDKFHLKNHFQAFVSVDDVQNGKPAPDIYIEAAKRLGVCLQECIVLEDSPSGALAGKEAGAYVIVIPNEWTKDHNFTHADSICASLYEAKDLINKMLSEGR